jgi:beta-lactamase class A
MRRSGFIGGACAAAALARPSAGGAETLRDDRIAEIEKRTGGRLGVVAVDTDTGTSIVHRGNERFPMCSTFKLLAVGAVLTRVDRGVERLQRPVAYGRSDLLAYAPVTTAHVADGSMTIEALCEAALVMSDNTAANLLLRTLGGPGAVTTYARSIGDAYTRLDRPEPDLNTALAGDARDTTVPLAFAADVRALALGDALSPASRARLVTWMLACRTGVTLLRAGVPGGWRVGDKSGSGGAPTKSGDDSTRNDVGLLWPPQRLPIVVAAYLTQAKVDAAQRDRALADVARDVAARFAIE